MVLIVGFQTMFIVDSIEVARLWLMFVVAGRSPMFLLVPATCVFDHVCRRIFSRVLVPAYIDLHVLHVAR